MGGKNKRKNEEIILSESQTIRDKVNIGSQAFRNPRVSLLVLTLQISRAMKKITSIFRCQGLWGRDRSFSSCLTFTSRTHDLGAKHHQLRTPQHTQARQDSRRHRKVLTHLRSESCRQVAETGPTWDSRSRSSPSPWGFWEPQTTFLMNQNTREITLWTVVIYCSTPHRKQPVEFYGSVSSVAQ